MSMKNEDTWQFAHHYMGRIWKISGIVTGAITLVVFLFLYGKGEDTVGTVGGALFYPDDPFNRCCCTHGKSAA